MDAQTPHIINALRTAAQYYGRTENAQAAAQLTALATQLNAQWVEHQKSGDQ